MPSTTLPKTTCLLSRNGVVVVVMKNWEPFVFGPEFCKGDLLLLSADRFSVAGSASPVVVRATGHKSDSILVIDTRC